MFQKNSLAVKRYSLLLRFAMWLQGLPVKMVPAPFRLIQIGSAFWQSSSLSVAARLDIATLLADGNLTVDDIADMIASHPDATYRLLRFLSAMGVFEEVTPRTFRNNKLSSYLRDDKPDNVRAMILMHNSTEMSLPWYQSLQQGVCKGDVPFEIINQQDLYAYMACHADFRAQFAAAMDSVEALSGDSFATDFDWSRFDRIIDVGGSKGSKSLAILKHVDHLRACVVDYPEVVHHAEEHWAGRIEASLLARISFTPGDALQSVPKAINDKDVYLLSAVLHAFDDATCCKVLGNIREAINATAARIVLFELVMPQSAPDIATCSFDMQMFIATKGRERTLVEWQSIFSASGVVLEEVVNLRSYGKLLVLKT